MRCESAAEKLEAVALSNAGTALRKRKVAFELDIKGAVVCDKKATTCRELAGRCRDLAQVFMGWRHLDPGIERRREHIEHMYVLARLVRPWGVDL
jgi:hypothetical protein